MLRIRAVKKNSGVFKYDVGTHMNYYRHELLKIPKVTDDEAYDMVKHKQNVWTSGEDWTQEHADYNVDEDWVPPEADVRDPRDDEKQFEV